MAIITDIEI